MPRLPSLLAPVLALAATGSGQALLAQETQQPEQTADAGDADTAASEQSDQLTIPVEDVSKDLSVEDAFADYSMEEAANPAEDEAAETGKAGAGSPPAEEAEAERLAYEQAEAERLAAEQAAAEKAAAEQAEAERLAAEQAEAEQLAYEQAEAERLAAEQAAAEKAAAEQAEAERLAAEQAEAERLASEQAEAARLAAEKAQAERAAADRAMAAEMDALLKVAALGKKVEAKVLNRGGSVVGVIELTQTPNGVLVNADISGLPMGFHGFHIHETGLCEPARNFTTAGGHFNPQGKDHGFKSGKGPHAGDLPNQFVHDDGELRTHVFATNVMLDQGENALMDADGSALIVHEGADDYISHPTGAAGGRLACAVLAPPRDD